MKKAYTFDESVQISGGFGKFQAYAMMTLISAFCTGGQIVYGLGYLTVYPQYLCQQGDTWHKCERAEICSSAMPVSAWKIDYESPRSFHNFVEKLDLTCKD
jgi:hypothetical protein